jgi:hydrogenase nickel incorporation protein HypA/HybF
MHESSLIPALLNTVERVAREAEAEKIVRISLTVGAFAAIAPDHLREHFVIAAAGTVAEGADLDIALLSDPGDPLAYMVQVQSLEVIEG